VPSEDKVGVQDRERKRVAKKGYEGARLTWKARSDKEAITAGVIK